MLPQSPSTLLLNLVAKTINNPKLLALLENSECFFETGYFYWPVECEGDESIYYAVNPDRQEIYELEYPTQPPFNGIPINREEDLLWLIEDLKDLIREIEGHEYLYPHNYSFPPESQLVFGATEGSIHSLS